MAVAQAQAFRIFFEMFSGIIVIAIAHGMILTPALLAECRFIHHGIGDQDQVIRTTASGEQEMQREEDQNPPKRERQVVPSKTSVIGMVKKATSHRTNDGAKLKLDDESESDQDS